MYPVNHLHALRSASNIFTCLKMKLWEYSISQGLER